MEEHTELLPLTEANPAGVISHGLPDCTFGKIYSDYTETKHNKQE
jgi:hypothetical protein